jgi:cytochrome c553
VSRTSTWFQLVRFAAAALTLAGCAPSKAPPGARLDWAYPDAPEQPFPTLGPGLHRVPGSTLALTAAQIDDSHNLPDWFPDEHPPAPDIVARDRPKGPDPCAECHLMNGQGFPGAASLTGLTPAYIAEQIREFRNGRRRSWQHDRFDTVEMTEVANKVSDAEVAQAAAYFAALPRPRWIRVVETDTVPVTRPDHYGWFDLVPNGGQEPIRGRIIEVPEDTQRLFLRDPHVGLIDYVPTGSLKRGEALVRSGGVGGVACTTCHGADLRGLGDTPPLAGRSAPYLARMLWDIKTGARRGPAVAAMQGPAAGLSEADITDIVAYLAARAP